MQSVGPFSRSTSLKLRCLSYTFRTLDASRCLRTAVVVVSNGLWHGYRDCGAVKQLDYLPQVTDSTRKADLS